ncbi:MAG: VOC family protein [Candidatus Hydrogenedentes bacterium]|jgi:methylmalonyl-CoA epimerase|nr:VOC family protein [Candidatus Hydrogenedentota bacterium]
MGIIGIDHLVVRVKDLDAAIENYKALGMELTNTMETDGIGKQAIFILPNGTFVELVAPTDPDSAVGKAIEGRGEGVHTVAFAVDDIASVVSSMKEGGARVIEGGGPAGAAFVHPKSTNGVLLQIGEQKH